MKKGVVVGFPGTGYTCREPLFADCLNAFVARGYDCVALNFAGIPFRQIETVEEALLQAQVRVRDQLAPLRFGEYADVAFVSKSLGTALAGWYASTLSVHARQFYLTPIAQSLPYVTDAARVVGMVIGTEDKVLDDRVVTAFCRERGIPCMVVDGVRHKLLYDDPASTARLNERIVSMCMGNPIQNPNDRSDGT